jgi:hypothetical protein
MDAVRCRCPYDSNGTRCGRHPACAIHGMHGIDPLVPYLLNESDKAILRGMRIGWCDAAAIAEVRHAEEQRFNPPRLGE